MSGDNKLEEIKMAIIMEGGIIEEIMISKGSAKVFIVDHDIEGVDETELSAIDVGEDEDQQVLLSKFSNVPEAPKFIEHLEEVWRKG